jgi:hypothetical protein
MILHGRLISMFIDLLWYPEFIPQITGGIVPLAVTENVSVRQ